MDRWKALYTILDKEGKRRFFEIDLTTGREEEIGRPLDTTCLTTQRLEGPVSPSLPLTP